MSEGIGASQDPVIAETVAMYNRIPEIFADHFAGFRSTIPDITLAHELAEIPLGESQVVEIGCGDGRDAETSFVPNSGSYVGYDPSQGLLDMARQRFAGVDPAKVRFEQGYAQTTNYPKDIDIMMAINSVLHIPDKELSDTFERVREGLRQHGVLYLVTKTEREDNAEVYHDDFAEKTGNHVVGERQFYYHSVEKLSDVAKKTGFVVMHNQITPVGDKSWDWLQFAVAKS